MLYNIIVIIFDILITFITVKFIFKESVTIKNKLIIVETVTLFIGILIRLYGIQYFPNGLNVDEASAGYEAYSILNYGIDRHGNHLPIFLESWGGGQNALLTYLIIPFIKILGLNVLSVRLPMAVLGCISLIIMFLLLKRIKNQKFAVIGLIFFAICPWHIMKSRWGLESNIFPDLILIFVYMLIKGIQDKNKILYNSSFIIAGLTAYAYGTAYFFLPIFIIGILIYLINQKEINIKTALINLLTIAIISLPIILCIFINKYNLNEIKMPFMTIPKLNIMRYENMSSIFSSDFIRNSLKNLIAGIKIIIMQDDGLSWNSLEISGVFYKISLILTILGIIRTFRNKKIIKYDFIFKMWFFTSILLLFVCEPNINRINIIWIPIIFYTILGIDYIVEDNKIIEKITLFIYLVFFIFFIREYFAQDYSEYFTFNTGIKDVVEYVDLNKKAYVTNSIKEPYIYFLFYKRYNTNDFVNSVKYKDAPNEEFQTVLSFGNFYFKNIDIIDDENCIYIIKNDELEKYNINLDIWNTKVINDYLIIERK